MRLERPAAPTLTRSRQIPRTVHQIWVGGSVPPASQRDFERRFRALHPRWAYRLWTDRDLDATSFSRFELIRRARTNAHRADLMRYEILYAHGGLYVDCDIEVHGALPEAELFDAHRLVFMLQPPQTHAASLFCNSFLAAAPRHPFLRTLIDTAGAVSGNPFYDTGPRHVTNAFLDRLAAGRLADLGLKVVRDLSYHGPFAGRTAPQTFPLRHTGAGTWIDA